MFPEICRDCMRDGNIGACPCINSGGTQLLCAHWIVRLVSNLPSVTACGCDVSDRVGRNKFASLSGVDNASLLLMCGPRLIGNLGKT